MKGGSLTGWQRGSPQGSPTPSFEGLLGEAMSVRARSLGFGDILPLAEGGGRSESQLLRSPYSAEEAGVRKLGRADAWLPSGGHSYSRPTKGRQVRTVGAEARLRSLSRRQIPLGLQAYFLLPHKGQKGTGEEIGSWSQGNKTMALQRGKVVGVSQVLDP